MRPKLPEGKGWTKGGGGAPRLFNDRPGRTISGNNLQDSHASDRSWQGRDLAVFRAEEARLHVSETSALLQGEYSEYNTR